MDASRQQGFIQSFSGIDDVEGADLSSPMRSVRQQVVNDYRQTILSCGTQVAALLRYPHDKLTGRRVAEQGRQSISADNDDGLAKFSGRQHGVLGQHHRLPLA
ncbi:hypothetical protein CEG18_15125 [Pseudomonas nitroreducens]|uniref:Uncharacterized protein n=1 Tax=Pseudomonas nitroreducens TaxID=46680 RepID=A0A246F830_PSENT|nr:hypothetical protein CEG18_15125 [Pseudomonas nitroreducens]